MKTRQITLRECIDAWARGENTFAQVPGSDVLPIAKPGKAPAYRECSAGAFTDDEVYIYFIEVPPSANELREEVVRKLLDNLVELKLLVEYGGNIYAIIRKNDYYSLTTASDEAHRDLLFGVPNFAGIKLKPNADLGFVLEIYLSFS